MNHPELRETPFFFFLEGSDQDVRLVDDWLYSTADLSTLSQRSNSRTSSTDGNTFEIDFCSHLEIYRRENVCRRRDVELEQPFE